ncbi:MAG: hypothetical protein ABIR70_11675 [Bryobacteraceae bacterium]
MRHFLLFLVSSAIALAQTPLSGAKNVFLMPMPGGLEQYIALQLTQGAVLQVVTDSSKADVVLTDRVGEDFPQSLAELDHKTTDQAQSGKAGEVVFAKPNMRPLSRARGTVFLVDRRTGDVLWSALEKPKGTSVGDLNTAAKHIVEELAKARKPKN